jgi:hypothetical protein
MSAQNNQTTTQSSLNNNSTSENPAQKQLNLKILVFILILLLILIGFILGILFYKGNLVFNKEALSNIPSFGNNSTPSPSLQALQSTLSPTANPKLLKKQYFNNEFKFSFTLEEDEEVVECPNVENIHYNETREFTGWISKNHQDNANATKLPSGVDLECGSEGTREYFNIIKTNIDANEEDFIKRIGSPEFNYNEYEITKKPIIVSGLKGYRIDGKRSTTGPAPIPDTIDEILLYKNKFIYTFTSDYYFRNITIY